MVNCSETRRQQQTLTISKVELQAKLHLEPQCYDTNIVHLNQALTETASVAARRSNLKVPTLLQSGWASNQTWCRHLQCKMIEGNFIYLS